MDEQVPDQNAGSASSDEPDVSVEDRMADPPSQSASSSSTSSETTATATLGVLSPSSQRSTTVVSDKELMLGASPRTDIEHASDKLGSTDASSEQQDAPVTYTIDDAISQMGMGKFQWRLLFFTGFIWAADAMEMMLLSFLVPKLKHDWNLERPEDGLISSVVFIGMLCGTSFWSMLSDRIGRRRVVVYTNLGGAVLGTLSALAPSIWWMLLCRFGVGFCVGGSSVAYSLYAEVVPRENRGEQLIYEQSFWGVGALFSVVVAWVSLTQLNWRWYLVFCAIPLWIISGFWRMVPESPRWLLACHRIDEAQALLERISKENGVDLPQGRLAQTRGTVTEMDDSALLVNDDQLSNNHQRGRISDVFAPAYRKTSILMFTVFSADVFVYYGISFISERYFQETSGDKSDKYWEMCVTTISELPALALGAYCLDRIGRKNTMTYSFLIYGVCALMVLFRAIQRETFAGLFFMFTARMVASLSFMAVYIYMSEYYPTVIRTTALGSASALGRISGVATSFIAQDLDIEVSMAVYAAVSMIAAICTWSLPIDTTGRVLQDSVDHRQHRQATGHVELEDYPPDQASSRFDSPDLQITR